MSETWRKTWREGIIPLLTIEQLQALKEGMEKDDPRLLQGATTTPPPLMCTQDWPVEAACGLGYCGWQGNDLEVVSEVEEFFARMCFEIDRLLAEPAGCRWFLNWWDETPRQEMFAEMLPEIERAIRQKQASQEV